MSASTHPHLHLVETTSATATTLFVVDDDPLVTSSLEAYLSLAFEDYRVVAFNNPLDALDALDAEQPKLVISDFLMPPMDGITFLTKVRQQLPETTVILLTGYADKENAIAAVNQANIFKYLEKPWNNTELQQVIESGLERATLLRDLRYTVGQLEEAQTALTRYSHELEGIVAERTHDVQQALTHLEAIVRGSGDGIATVAADGTVLTANPTLLAWAAEECLSTALQQPLTQWLAVGTFAQWMDTLTPDGLGETRLGQRPVEVSASPLVSDSHTDNDAAWVLIFRDLTRRKAEERLREDFVATLTHDLRVPLLAAIQTLEMLANETLGSLNERQAEVARMLVTNNQDVLGLVNTLLDIYRYESGQKQLLRQPVNLAELAQHVVNQMDALATSRQHTIQLELPAETPTIQADKQELQRVMTNLVGNAIHHTAAGSTITLSVTTSPTAIAFSVRDTGRGIPPEDQAKLFQRFSQGTKQTRSSGSGLGLYLCRQIVERHGGTITLESILAPAPNHGSTFTVTLPIG